MSPKPNSCDTTIAITDRVHLSHITIHGRKHHTTTCSAVWTYVAKLVVYGVETKMTWLYRWLFYSNTDILNVAVSWTAPILVTTRKMSAWEYELCSKSWHNDTSSSNNNKTGDQNDPRLATIQFPPSRKKKGAHRGLIRPTAHSTEEKENDDSRKKEKETSFDPEKNGACHFISTIMPIHQARYMVVQIAQTCPISMKSGPSWPHPLPLSIADIVAPPNPSNQQLRTKICPRAQLKRTLLNVVQISSLNARFEAREEEIQIKKTMTSSSNCDASWNPLLLLITEHETNTSPTQLRQSQAPWCNHKKNRNLKAETQTESLSPRLD